MRCPPWLCALKFVLLETDQEIVMKSSHTIFRTVITRRRAVWFVLLLLVCLMMAGIAAFAFKGASASCTVLPEDAAGAHWIGLENGSVMRYHNGGNRPSD